MRDPVVFGDQLPLHERPRDHGRPTHDCPRCGTELNRVAIVDLAYVFDVCTCGIVDYAHLVEQLWHRDCLVAEAGDAAMAAMVEREALIKDVRRETLAKAIKDIMAEAGRGEKSAPPAQRITYTGGLRRAARLIDASLGEVLA